MNTPPPINGDAMSDHEFELELKGFRDHEEREANRHRLRQAEEVLHAMGYRRCADGTWRPTTRRAV